MSMPGPWAVRTAPAPGTVSWLRLNKAKYAAVTSPFRVSVNNVDRAIWANSGGSDQRRLQPGDADKRQLFKVGVGAAQLTPASN